MIHLKPKFIVSFFSIILVSQLLFAQKEDYNWLYGCKLISFKSLPAKTVDLPIICNQNDNMFIENNIAVSDSLGNLIYITRSDSLIGANNILFSNSKFQTQPSYTFSLFEWAPNSLNNQQQWLYNYGNSVAPNGINFMQYLVDRQTHSILSSNVFNSPNQPNNLLGIIQSDLCNFSWKTNIYYSDNTKNTITYFKSCKIGSSGLDTNDCAISNVLIPNKFKQGINFVRGASSDGKIFVFGGFPSNSLNNTLVFYNFSSNIGEFSHLKTVTLSGSINLDLNSRYFGSYHGYFSSNLIYYYFYVKPNKLNSQATGLYRLRMSDNYIEPVFEEMGYLTNLDMRLGPDNSLVFMGNMKKYLGCSNNCPPDSLYQILNPEAISVIDLKIKSITVVDDYSTISQFPMNYSNKRGYRGINVSNICLGDSTNFSASDLCIGNIPIWNFNDGNGTVVGMNVKHKYVASGDYIVDVIYGNELIKKKVTILGKPLKPNLGIDTQLVCKSPYFINLTQAGVSFWWQDGTYRSTYTATTTGMYTVTVSNGCFASSDTVNLHFSNPPIILKDSILPCNVAVSLDGGQIFDTYQWSTGANSRFLSVTTPGTFWVKSTNSCGSFADTVKITWKSPIPPKVNYRPSLIGISDSCISNSIGFSFKDTIGVKSLDWDFGDGEKANASIPMHKFSIPQTYLVTAKATHLCYIDSSSRKIGIEQIPYINLGLDTVVDCGQPIVLSAGVGFKNYQWQDGSSFSTLTVLGSGTYSVRVFNACGSVSDTIEIKKRPVVFPNVFTPNSDGKNDELLLGNYLPKTGKLSVLNRWGEEVFKSDQYQNDWKAENLVSDGLYFYRFENGCERVQGYLQVLR